MVEIGSYIILEKIKDKRFNGNHPNFINPGSREIRGLVRILPEVGKQFFLFDGLIEDRFTSWTSVVEKWDNETIETENSIYKIIFDKKL